MGYQKKYDYSAYQSDRVLISKGHFDRLKD